MDLPIVGTRGRNPLDLVLMQPGVVSGAPTGGSIYVHGARDRITDPAGSLDLGRRARGTAARIARFEIARAGHTMLERLPLWQALTRRFVLGALGLEAMDDRIAAAFALPPERALRVPL